MLDRLRASHGRGVPHVCCLKLKGICTWLEIPGSQSCCHLLALLFELAEAHCVHRCGGLLLCPQQSGSIWISAAKGTCPNVQASPRQPPGLIRICCWLIYSAKGMYTACASFRKMIAQPSEWCNRED